jgi:hypothetical protein
MVKKVRDFKYYKTRIDKGFYPSTRIFRQSLGRSTLREKDKIQLISYAESILPESVPGRSRKLEPAKEVPALTPQILQMVEITEPEPIPDEPGRPLQAAYGGAKARSLRAERLILLIKLLSVPSRGDFLLFMGLCVGENLIHPELSADVDLAKKLFPDVE